MTSNPPLPSLTPTWHNDAYPAIAYTNPSLSQAGKTVIITGAGSGIGRESAVGVATAGASHVVLISRNEARLRETAEAVANLSQDAKVSVYQADVTDYAAVKKIADAVGTWDAILHCAGYVNKPTPVASVDLEDYWKAFEINLKSTLILSKHFLSTANSNHAAFLTYMAGAAAFPAQALVGLSGYIVSKVALAKLMEFLAAENPNVTFMALHPGMVDTGLFRSSGATPEMLPMDTPQLPAGFGMWATTPEAKFLSGKTVFANWDVEELKGMKDEVANGLTFGLQGWPFPHGG